MFHCIIGHQIMFLTWIKHEQPSYLVEKFWSGVNVSLYHRPSNHVSYLDKASTTHLSGRKGLVRSKCLTVS